MTKTQENLERLAEGIKTEYDMDFCEGSDVDPIRGNTALAIHAAILTGVVDCKDIARRALDCQGVDVDALLDELKGAPLEDYAKITKKHIGRSFLSSRRRIRRVASEA